MRWEVRGGWFHRIYNLLCTVTAGVRVFIVRVQVAGAADQAIFCGLHVLFQRPAHGTRVLHWFLELRKEVRLSGSGRVTRVGWNLE